MADFCTAALNILQYREYVGRGLYKDHLKLTAGLMVLNVTTSERTLDSMMKLAGEVSKKGNTYLLFRACDHFGRYFKPPGVLPEILTGEWQRAGYPPFRIDGV